MDSELLFLLIIILTVVINIVKAINKKRGPAPQGAAPATSANPASPPAESDWQKVLRELLGESPAPPRPVPYQYDDEVESLETLEPLGGYIKSTSEYTFETPEFTSSTFGEEPFTVESSTTSAGIKDAKTTGYQLNQWQRELRSFDLRKAVIYSSILNRPYA